MEELKELEAAEIALEKMKAGLIAIRKIYKATNGGIEPWEQKNLDKLRAEVAKTTASVAKKKKEYLARLNQKQISSNKAPCSGGDSYTQKFYDCKEGIKYELSILVDQPGEGGDRDTYEGSPLTSIDVGHTFVRLIKTNTDSSKVEAVLGFYPSKAVSPTEPEVGGKLNIDKGHGAEVKATKVLTHKQFFAALKYIESNKSKTYNLNTYNCTDFGIGVAGAAGWNISSKRGSWLFGGGHNPGDLGEDLKDNYNGQVISNTTGGNGSSKNK